MDAIRRLVKFDAHRLERKEALARINEAIRSAVDRLKKRGFQTHATTVADAGETKFFVHRDKLEVTIDVRFVLRGTSRIGACSGSSILSSCPVFAGS